MAVNVFGDVIEESAATQPAANVNVFGDIVEAAPAPAPRVVQPSDYDIFRQQYIAQQQRPTLTKAIEQSLAPIKAVGGIVKDIAGIPKGLGQVAGSETPIATAARSQVEGARRAGVDIVNLIRNVPEMLLQANPVGAAINLANIRSRTPLEDEIQKAFQEQQLQQNVLRPENQLIQGEVAPALVEGTRQAIPLLLPMVGAEERLATANLFKEALKTGATAATTPISAYYGAKSAEPFLSGARLAEAESGVESALQKQTALNRSIQESLQKEQIAQQGLESGVAENRLEAAIKGREALQAGRGLKRLEETVTPEIVASRTSFEEAKNLPVVILGATAEEAPAFGRQTIASIEKPIKASEASYTEAYKAVEDSLPTVEPKVPAHPLFDAAKTAQGELSQGFEAYNKGEIRKILDETSRITKSKVPPEIQSIYDNASATTKTQLAAQYPDLVLPSGGIPQYTWSELQTRFRQINQGINQAVKYGNVNDARILGDLKRGITESMENYASQMGPETYDLFKKANADYAAHQNKFGLNRVQTLFRDDVLQNPELVARDLIAYDNPSQVTAIKSIVSPEEFAPVQSQFSKKFFSPADDVPFDSSHFVKQFSKPGARETVKAVFGEEGLAQFQQVYDASKGIAKIEDFQKAINDLATQSESATKAFQKAKGAANEAEKVMAEKNRIKKLLKPFNDADVQDKISAVNKDLKSAVTELDRVKNYRDLRDWASRISGLNILQAAFDSEGGRSLLISAAANIDKINNSNVK